MCLLRRPNKLLCLQSWDCLVLRLTVVRCQHHCRRRVLPSSKSQKSQSDRPAEPQSKLDEVAGADAAVADEVEHVDQAATGLSGRRVGRVVTYRAVPTTLAPAGAI